MSKNIANKNPPVGTNLKVEEDNIDLAISIAKKADLLNIVKKLKSGRALTSSELRRLQNAKPKAEVATTSQPNRNGPVVGYDSVPAAAGGMGISADLLRRARKAGCPNFRGGRVYVEGLERWIADNSEALQAMGTNSLKDQVTSLQIRKLTRIENTADRILVNQSEIAATIRRVLSKSAAMLEVALVNEYPSRSVGLDVAEVRELGKQIYDRLMADLKSLGKEFGE